MVHPATAKLRRPSQIRRLALLLTLATVGFAACGDDDGGETDAATTSGVESDVSTDAAEAGEDVVIKTQVKINAAEENRGSNVSRGEILDGSTIGDTPFCPGGTFQDAHSEDPAIGFVDRTIQCSDGSLRIGFSPGEPEHHKQSGPWKVLGGTGNFEGLRGAGEMEVTGSRDEGRETFTGTVQT